MKILKTVLSLAAVAIVSISMTACGSSGESKTYSSAGAAEAGVQSEGNALIISGNTDSKVGVSYTEIGDGSVLVECGGDDCDVSVGIDTGSSSSDGADSVEDGVYKADYNAAQCSEAGFFFCSIEQKCLNQPTVGGTCPASADGHI